jgi:hypothetical protein
VAELFSLGSMSIIASIGVAPILFFVVVGGVFIAWHFSRSKSLLQKWATSNEYEILHSELRELRRGPFLWTGSGKQTVYYVRVRSRDGHERSAWVRCGGFWSGLLSDKTEVRWDDETRAA